MIESGEEKRNPKNVGGYYSLWPLHVVVTGRYTGSGEKQRAREVLGRVGRVGREMGLRNALRLLGWVMVGREMC